MSSIFDSIRLERGEADHSAPSCSMNGLRYHYQHSGAHGALGLQMLAQACHPPPQFPPGHKRAVPASSASASTVHAAGGSAASSRSSSPAPHGMGRGLSPNQLTGAQLASVYSRVGMA